MPGHKVPGPDLGNMHHRAVELQVRVHSQLGELHAVPRRRAGDLARHVLAGRELPVPRVQEPRPVPAAAGPAGPQVVVVVVVVAVQRRPRPEEGPQQRVRRGQPQQRVHQQRALPGAHGAQAQPALEHPEGAAGAEPAVQVVDGADARARVPRVVSRLPVPGEDGVVRSAAAVPRGHPPLHAAAVLMRAQREGGVTRPPDAEAVGVGKGVGEGHLGGRVGRVPGGLHEGPLHAHEVGVDAGAQLRRGPVEFPYLRISRREAWGGLSTRWSTKEGGYEDDKGRGNGI